MTQTLTFEEYVKNESQNEDYFYKEYEYDDYSIITDIDYTIQE